MSIPSDDDYEALAELENEQLDDLLARWYPEDYEPNPYDGTYSED